jgi:isocitrate lyase
VGGGRKQTPKTGKLVTFLRLTKGLFLSNTFQFAHAYANGEGMKHYVNMVQEPEFAARDKGYTFVSHQQEVGAGYFDDVTTVIQGGSSSVKALTGSTEEEQFH